MPLKHEIYNNLFYSILFSVLNMFFLSEGELF